MFRTVKKPLCALLALCLLCGCLGETAQEPEYMDIIRLVSRCTLLMSFEGAPGGELAEQAAMSRRELYPEDSGKTDEEIYALIFAEGEYAPAEEDVPPPEDCEVWAEEAQALDDGRIKVDVSVYRDEGEGMEFDCAFYAYFILTDGGYRLCGVFFPD